ncbi:MAG: flavodoxin-dependent (E)-4-hydroxy-3-methylbut-2-enyl-diphosphate synthase [Candidatus Alcyoniella australis]|nr:flavodoxin-dependent (E)-4-hydroxy-3-methylbut-2-enyl-diphosphate synthase [Candidatus Alcyoniella australis]
MEIKLPRERTRRLKVGAVEVGGGAAVSVQSMTNTSTADADATLAQIERLAAVGCEIVRCSVPDNEAARALCTICKHSPLPLVADIHFDHNLALAALDAGVQGLRVNPGTLGGERHVAQLARALCVANVPVRIGINAGSMERSLVEKHGGVTPAAMLESALGQARAFEEHGVTAIKLSLKASNVGLTIAAYRLAAQNCDYPLHVGVTEAGTRFSGAIRSAVGIGVLLLEGIGDTIRVSLSGDPLPEVRAGWEILRAVGLRSRGISVVSCPTCARAAADVAAVAERLELELGDRTEPLEVAVMGCTVNGPGECREADLGVVARSADSWQLYVSGRLIGRIESDDPAQIARRINEVIDSRDFGG